MRRIIAGFSAGTRLVFVLLVFVLLVGPASLRPASAQKPKALPRPALPAKVLTCGSLANLRILLAETAGDTAAIKARLADSKADHLGCTRIGRDRIESNAERVVIGGTAYDCLAVKETRLCRWALSGVPAEAP